MLNGLCRTAEAAQWIAAAALVGLLACALAAWLGAEQARRRASMAKLSAVRHPVQALCEAARTLRETMEASDGLARLMELELFRDGSLAQRIRDVRALSADGVVAPRTIEAVYEAREAAARLVVWLERLSGDKAQTRLQIQTIWKALHDAAGNIDRDVAAQESRRRR